MFWQVRNQAKQQIHIAFIASIQFVLLLVVVAAMVVVIIVMIVIVLLMVLALPQITPKT